MNQERIDNYISVKQKEDGLIQELKEVKQERAALMNQLSEEMDAESITKMKGSDGSSVSAVHNSRATVDNFSAFKTYVELNGLQSDYLKEVVKQRELNGLVKAAIERSKRAGIHPDEFMPPGTKISFDTHLRVNKPKEDGSDFMRASKSLIETLKENE